MVKVSGGRLAMAAALMVAASCTHGGAGDPALGSTSAAISVQLGGAPSGIDCIDLVFLDEDGTSQSFARAIPATAQIAIEDLAAGAYDLSASAYSSGMTPPIDDAACAAVPPQAPWATESPVAVVLEQDQFANASITLVPSGGVSIGVGFAQTPQVIAQAQGAVGQIAANGSLAAWLVNGTGSSAQVLSLDTSSATLPTLVAAGQTNTSEIVIDPATGTLFWTESPSGARDAGGNPIDDGSVWQSTGSPSELASNQSPGDIQVAGNSTAYWGDMASNSIMCSACTSPFAPDQPGPNVLTAHGGYVYWGDGNTGEIYRQATGSGAPTLLYANTGRVAYSMSADDTSLYYADYSNTTGDEALWSLPIAGGTPTLVLDAANGFPIAAQDGYLYWVDFSGSAVHRVPVGGGSADDLVDGVIGGFAITHDGAGDTLLYWTDNTHGGLVWAGQLD